jgi:VWFA-related protein
MRTHFPLRPAFALGLAIVVVLVVATVQMAAQGSSERTLYVSAVDEHGAPVRGLGPDAFTVREDGATREVLRVTPATDPIDLALLVDNSQAAEHDITFIRESVRKFVALMSADNPTAIIGLAERPTILADYTTDAKTLAGAIGRIFATPRSGMTLLDAIVEVAHGLDKREAPRAAMIAIITDGTEFTNRYSRDVTAALTDAHVPLYAVAVGQFYYSDEHDTRERALLLDQGPATSGGERVSLVAASGIEPALLAIGRELKGQYKVVYSRPESLIPPKTVTVASARAGVTMRGATARGQKDR